MSAVKRRDWNRATMGAHPDDLAKWWKAEKRRRRADPEWGASVAAWEAANPTMAGRGMRMPDPEFWAEVVDLARAGAEMSA
jgi:hypothetical protein